jgi:DNA replication protein DnaC
LKNLITPKGLLTMAHFPDNSEIQNLVKTGQLPTRNLAPMAKDCAQHGPYPASGYWLTVGGGREVWSPCPDCVEAELVATRQAELVKKAQREGAIIESMLVDAAVPQRFIGRTLGNFTAQTEPQQLALRVAQDFAANFPQHLQRGTGLVLSGLPGTGKSHLATAILQALMPQHCGLYTTCLNVIRAVRATWRRDSEFSESEVLGTFAKVPLLVLDEIGVQYGTEGEQTILFDVLDRRYRDMKPSILLTNQNRQGFKEFVGERTFDRLTESARWVSFDWPSYRAQARKEAV